MISSPSHNEKCSFLQIISAKKQKETKQMEYLNQMMSPFLYLQIMGKIIGTPDAFITTIPMFIT